MKDSNQIYDIFYVHIWHLQCLYINICDLYKIEWVVNPSILQCSFDAEFIQRNVTCVVPSIQTCLCSTVCTVLSSLYTVQCCEHLYIYVVDVSRSTPLPVSMLFCHWEEWTIVLGLRLSVNKFIIILLGKKHWFKMFVQVVN